MTQPTLSVELGRLEGWVLGESLLGTDTTLAEYVYEDITSRVVDLNIRRGRQHELDRIEAGTLSGTLMNQDGAFNPLNTLSPFYPDIRPMVPLRIRASYFAPQAIAGLVAWYDFTDAAALFTDTARTTPVSANGQTIKGVTDKSGNGNHLTEATNGPTYTVGAINGKSSGRFDGTNDLLTVATLSTTLTQPYTIFIAGKYLDVAVLNDPTMDGKTGERSHPVLVNAGTSGKFGSFYGTGIVNSSVDDDTSSHVFLATANGASSALRIDGGANTISGNPGTNSITTITLANNVAAGGSAFANIDFLHLLAYSGDLSAADKDEVGQGLADIVGTTWTPVS